MREFAQLPSSWPPARVLGGVGAAVADTVSAESPESAESPGLFQNPCFCLEGRNFWLGTALSRDVFLTFVGQPRTNGLLLRQVSEHGRPNFVSKVGVSHEASQKKSKKRRAETSPAFSLDVFRTFFIQHRENHLLLRTLLYDVLRIWVVENTPQGS